MIPLGLESLRIPELLDLNVSCAIQMNDKLLANKITQFAIMHAVCQQ